MSTPLAQWIDRQPWFHTMMRVAWIRKLISRLLLRSPSRSFSSDTTVKVTDLESLHPGNEIFQSETYRRALELAGEVHAVIDLGCNIGFFCCYLRHHYGRNDFHGFGIDANVKVLEIAEHNFELNGLKGVELFQGLVGNMEENLTPNFFIHASHPLSSQFIPRGSEKNWRDNWTKMEVPVLVPGEIWRDGYGDEPIDLLKIDIAGSEGNLLRADPALFWQTKCIVLKWYKEFVEGEELFPVLHDFGFTRREVLASDAKTELLFFSRAA